MITLNIYDRKTTIRNSDYIFDKTEKLEKLLPYIKPKLSGKWVISVVEPPIKYVREIYSVDRIPDYVQLDLYVDKDMANQLIAEHPKLQAVEKTPYERYLDIIAEMKIMIKPKAASELYYRVSRNMDKATDYLVSLSKYGEITLDMVRKHVIDERVVYASDVLRAFLTLDRLRWTKYNRLIESLGESYAFNALRNQAKKFLQDKNKYLRNEESSLWYIDKIPAPQICYAYMLFNRSTSKELFACMILLDNFELRRAVNDL